jgi:hypothetical protein
VPGLRGGLRAASDAPGATRPATPGQPYLSGGRRNYPEIEIRFQLTKDAFHEYFVPNEVSIDFLHIDADHHYEGAKLDWDLYSTLVAENGVITLHDTVNYREPCGVPQLVEEIRRDAGYEVIDFPISYGTAIVRKFRPHDAADRGPDLPPLTGRR